MEQAGQVQVDERARVLRAARARLTRAHGYVVCGHLIAWPQEAPPILCALPRQHLGPHRQPA